MTDQGKTTLDQDRDLLSEYYFYRAHQKDFLEQYEGMVVVIKNHQVLGTYETELDAVTETCKSHELGTFLVQAVTEGEDAYTTTFHSPDIRVA